MSESALLLRIITPERVVLSKKVESVTLPGGVGEMQILPGHAAMFSTLLPGQISVVSGGKTSIWATSTGFVEVNGSLVKVLVDAAEGNSEIDPAEAQRLIEEAEDKLKNISNEDVEERFAFETQLAHARARIKVYERSTEVYESEGGFSQVDLEPARRDDGKQ